MNIKTLSAGLLSFLLLGCAKEETLVKNNNNNTFAAVGSNTLGSLGRIGSTTDVSRTTSGGTLLMGGGTDVDAAMRWMITKAGGGDIVVLRSTGTDGYNAYLFGLQTCNSVETILIDSRTVANDAGVEAKIRNAEAVFIAGGNQFNYISFWKDTKVEDALNFLRNTKGCVIGGTSAGCMIQGRNYYMAQNGSVLSAAATANPYNVDMTLGRNDFLDNPYLSNLITDTHFNNPDRRGRLIAFMARISKDNGIVPFGVGIDEATAVCIEANGSSKVFGTGTAFFLRQNTTGPETCVSGSRLDWYRSKQAVRCYKINGTANGANTFNFANWTGAGGTSQFYFVDRGTLGVN
ncbi:MAG: cyanophycinase [Cytophagales bacterium]|nr:MAG: cyanophycinase [Cytophagales bacterium]